MSDTEYVPTWDTTFTHTYIQHGIERLHIHIYHMG